MTTLCTHGVQTGAGYECSACVTTPTPGRLLALDCRCVDDFTDAACPDHGLLAFLRAAIAAEEARDATAEGASS